MPRQFNIPELGTNIVLAEDWTFPLHHEPRNDSLFEVMGMAHEHNWRDEPDPPPHPVTVPKGAALTIDRIYIRKGAKDYSSVTFRWPGQKTTRRTKTFTYRECVNGPERSHSYTIPAQGVRFWAKLADVNRMVIEG